MEIKIFAYTDSYDAGVWGKVIKEERANVLLSGSTLWILSLVSKASFSSIIIIMQEKEVTITKNFSIRLSAARSEF